MAYTLTRSGLENLQIDIDLGIACGMEDVELMWSRERIEALRIVVLNESQLTQTDTGKRL